MESWLFFLMKARKLFVLRFLCLCLWLRLLLLNRHRVIDLRLFGGRLMQWIDVVAGVVARRHSGCEVTTASVDQLEFQAPAFVNDTIAMEGRITHVGRTSMEVRVDTFVESLGGERRQVNRAYLVMVALDPKTHKPTPVPSLLLETEEDFAEWEAGNLRAKARKARRG